MIRLLLGIAIFTTIVGCSSGDSEVENSMIDPSEKSVLNTNLVHPGNRYFSEIAKLSVEPTRIDVSNAVVGEPWLSALSESGGGSVWSVTGEDGTWTTVLVSEEGVSGSFRATTLEGDGAIPAITRVDDPTTGSPAQYADSRPENPVLLSLMSTFENRPDGLTVFADQARMYSYATPTDRYPHGALGDKSEWTELVGGTISRDKDVDRYRLPDDEVFEGLYPMSADLTEDGVEEIITTVSTENGGSRLVVFSYDDHAFNIVAESEPIGTGFRWLHQLAVAPFGPNGEIEITVVRTPHVGGIAQFYRLDGDQLKLVASNAGGYMSHVNGSRNLDQAVAADLDGDGSVELLVPSRDQETLIALRRVGDSIEEAWTLALGAKLASNLAVVRTVEDELILGAVTQSGELLIWH